MNEDPDYDEIEYLIDNDPIELGRRLRATKARAETAEAKLRSIVVHAVTAREAIEAARARLTGEADQWPADHGS